MTHKLTSYFTSVFCFMFWSFLAVHYTHMKSPNQNREIASWKQAPKPFYDASYKL